MDATVADVPAAFRKLHFLKLECNTSSDAGTLKYNLKNHFNAGVTEIIGHLDESANNIELEAFDSSKNCKGSTNKLFSMTISKQSDVMEYDMHCELMSMTGQLISSITMKDTGLSTYNYNVLDSTGALLFQVSRKLIQEGHTEFQITTLDGYINARVNIHNGKVFLSMVPELDSCSKVILVCLMMVMDLAENQQKESNGVKRDSAVNAPAFYTGEKLIA